MVNIPTQRRCPLILYKPNYQILILLVKIDAQPRRRTVFGLEPCSGLHTEVSYDHCFEEEAYLR